MFRTFLILLTVITLFLPGVFAPVRADGGLDAGGGVSEVDSLRNHGSLGAPFAPGETAAGAVRLRAGLIEVLYPATGDPTADTDGNGLPDAWEREHFGTIGVDPAGDADSDGTSEDLEYRAGTDPRDATSVFRPEALNGSGGPVLRFDTVTGRDYRIWESDDLVDWTVLQTRSGTGGTLETAITPDPVTGRAFLRIEILIP